MELKKNLDGYTPSCPSPFFRIRVGDRITFHLKYNEKSIFPHSIDLHAVNGPGRRGDGDAAPSGSIYLTECFPDSACF